MMIKFMVVLHGVNDDEVELGPFSQVCFEMDVIGTAVVPIIKDVSTSEPIAYSNGGWWFHDGQPYKQAFTRAIEVYT
jgi:hypothetical protein